jgi:hypothetical protein
LFEEVIPKTTASSVKVSVIDEPSVEAPLHKD